MNNEQERMDKNGMHKETSVKSGPLTNQELENIDILEKRLEKDSSFVHISMGESKILRFNLYRAPEKVLGRMFNERQSTRIRFFVNYLDDEEKRDTRSFDVNMRSARLILSKLKQGYRILRIERVGSGVDTLYLPHEIHY